jgi:hypothetical protein
VWVINSLKNALMGYLGTENLLHLFLCSQDGPSYKD